MEITSPKNLIESLPEESPIGVKVQVHLYGELFEIRKNMEELNTTLQAIAEELKETRKQQDDFFKMIAREGISTDSTVYITKPDEE